MDTTRYVIRVERDEDVEQVAESIPNVVKILPLVSMIVADLTDDDVQQLQNDSRIRRIREDDSSGRIDTDQSINYEWQLDRIDQRELPLNDLFRYQYDGTGVTIYIMDTGIRDTHNELSGRVGAGYSPVDGSPYTDEYDHGTGVASSAAGSMTGPAKGATISSVKVIDGEGTIIISDVVDGANWIIGQHDPATDQSIVNMSMSFYGGNQDIEDAVQDMIDAGIFVCTSGGNRDWEASEDSPQRMETVMAVGGTNARDEFVDGWNFGEAIDILAPGYEVWIAAASADDHYAFRNGTSFASPLAAGVAAVVMQQIPGMTPSEVKAAVLSLATTGKILNLPAGTPNVLAFSAETLGTEEEIGLVSEVANGPYWLAGARVYYSRTLLVDPIKSSIPFGVAVEGTNFIVADANPTAIWTELDAYEDLVMVGGSNGKIAISEDGAETWAVHDGPKGTNVIRCVISRFATNHQYVMYEDSFWETHDGGQNWVLLQEAEAGESFRDLNISFERNMIAMAGGRLLIDGYSGDVQTFTTEEAQPTEIMCVTAHIREDKFFAIDSTGRTWATNESAGTELIQRESVPVGDPQWRGMWRDGAIPELLYIALGTGGLYKSVDGFRTSAGYFALRIPGQGNSPVDAVYRRVGLQGEVYEAPPVSSITVYLIGTHGFARRISEGQWEEVVTPFGSPNQMISPRGVPDRLWARDGGNLWTSIDAGQNWTSVTVPEGLIWIFCEDNEPDIIYLTAGHTIQKSIDGGSTWTVLVDDSLEGATAATNISQAEWSNGRIWWSQRRQGPGQPLTGNVIHWTDDQGATMSSVPQSGGSPNIAVSHDDYETLYYWYPTLVTSRSVIRYRSSDDNHLTVSPDDTSVGNEYPLWTAASGSSTVFIYWSDLGADLPVVILRSGSQGDNWTEVLGPIDELRSDNTASPMVIVPSPITPTQWWVSGGLNGGDYIFVSNDDGGTWQSEVCNIPVGNHRQIVVTG